MLFARLHIIASRWETIDLLSRLKRSWDIELGNQNEDAPKRTSGEVIKIKSLRPLFLDMKRINSLIHEGSHFWHSTDVKREIFPGFYDYGPMKASPDAVNNAYNFSDFITDFDY